MRIRSENGRLIVPSVPTIVYIEGDGVGQEITDRMIIGGRMVPSTVSSAPGTPATR